MTRVEALEQRVEELEARIKALEAGLKLTVNTTRVYGPPYHPPVKPLPGRTFTQQQADNRPL